MQVREERPEDAAAVRSVHLAAFQDHGVLVNRLVDALRRHPPADPELSLVATAGDEVVGHVMLTRSLLDAPRRLVDVAVLSPVGVRPEHQRRGVGSALVRHGLEVLAERGVPLVFLEGSPRYYPRFGFEPAASLGFRKPSLRIPDAAFQVLRLPAHTPEMTGTLVYAQAFWDVDAVGLREPEAG